MKQNDSIGTFILSLAGLIVWGLHLALVYATTTLACLRPQTADPLFDFRAVSTAFTALLLFGLGAHLLRQSRRNAAAPVDGHSAAQFLHVTGFALAILGAAAILSATLPLFMIPDCRTQ